MKKMRSASMSLYLGWTRGRIRKVPVMKSAIKVGALPLVVGLTLFAAACGGMAHASFEVWITDQSGTAGSLYIYDDKT